MERTQGQWVDYWRKQLSQACENRTRFKHGVERRMSVEHPLKALRGWLKVSEEHPDGSPVQFPSIYI